MPSAILNPEKFASIWNYCIMGRNQKYHSLHVGAQLLQLCPTLDNKYVSNSLQPHGLYIARQAPLSMGFSRQEYWSGLPFPSPGDLPNPRTKPGSSALHADSLPTEQSGKSHHLPRTSEIISLLQSILYTMIKIFSLNTNLKTFNTFHHLKEKVQNT